MKMLHPQFARKGKRFEHWITASSPEWQRVAAIQMTRYLCLETGYRQDLEKYAASWSRNKTSVLAMTDDVFCQDGNERHALIGIMTFHTFHENAILYHCYLHPFYRRGGRMKQAWSEAQERYPQYKIEHPLSAAMKRFLSKVDCSHVLDST